ncbi:MULTISPECIES: fimbrial protein [Enterobacter]|uniref:fimbrial protein n=1 Tax=Enterobacter TaxID=547 RepID=UPI002366E1DD|nr:MULTISPECIES: fimbrial protein [Enterobacter]
MHFRQLSGYSKLVSFIIVLFMGAWSQSSLATWTGAYGYQYYSKTVCATSRDENISSKIDYGWTAAPICSFDIGEGNAVPESGQYSLVGFFSPTIGDGTRTGWVNNPQYINAGVQLKDLQLAWTGPLYGAGSPYPYICYALRNTSTQKMYKFNSTPMGCTNVTDSSDLPPGPGMLKCSFNNGNALNVSLGDVARSEMGTAPGSTPAVEKQIDVTCTGAGTATYSINFQYTAIDISGDELVTTSANGLAVAMSFNDELINTTGTYTRTYSVGSQSESLKFEPVRNPSVSVSDIPTGAFSASAVMVLTIQ